MHFLCHPFVPLRANGAVFGCIPVRSLTCADDHAVARTASFIHENWARLKALAVLIPPFLLAQEVHPRIVQERLEHADIGMTLNRYSHVTPDMQRSAADTLDAAFTMVSLGQFVVECD